jgi:trehalose-6-phosphate synthase
MLNENKDKIIKNYIKNDLIWIKKHKILINN